jgi:hypothetical protein
MFGTRARAVDILDAEGETTALCPGGVMRAQGGLGVAEMKSAGGAGGKSGVDIHESGS